MSDAKYKTPEVKCWKVKIEAKWFGSDDEQPPRWHSWSEVETIFPTYETAMRDAGVLIREFGRSKGRPQKPMTINEAALKAGITTPETPAETRGME